MASIPSDELIEDRIASLRSELTAYGADIVNLVQGIYGQHQVGPKYDLKNSPFQMISLLKQEVAELLKQSKEQSELLAKYENDISYCKGLIDILARISSIVELFNEFEASINSLKLAQCCKVISAIDSEIAGLPTSNTFLGSGHVLSCLRTERKLIRSRFIIKIRRLLSESITYDNGCITVQKHLSGYLRCEDRVVDDSIALADIWIAVTSINCTEQVLDTHWQDIWNFVLLPLWKEKKNQSPSISSSSDRAEFQLGSIARENIDWSHLEQERVMVQGVWTLGQAKIPLPSLFEHLSHLASFLFGEVFCGNSTIAGHIGRLLIDEPYKLPHQLLDIISNHIPKSESDLVIYKRTLDEPAKGLEWKLENYFKLSHSKFSSEFLSIHLSNLQSIFSSFRRKEILKNARDLVLLDYHNTMIASGDALEDALASAGDIGDPRALLDQSGTFVMQRLKFDSCQVSLASCRLLKFVHEVMTQAVMASSDVSNILFHSARDCLEIFAAIVPVKFAEVIDSIPRMGAVFYNDCLYIAHNAILLTHKYRLDMARGNEALQGSIGFIDFIPRMRKLGDACMQSHLSQQQAVVRTMVERIKISPDREQTTTGPSTSESLIKGGLQIAGKLRSRFLKASANIDVDEGTISGIDIRKLTDEDDANDDARANLLVSHLESLRTQWVGVLPEAAFARFMGLLIDDALQLVMAPVLQTDCITETACGEITRVFKTILRSRSLLPAEDPASNISWRHICPSLRKFAALTELFDYNLNDIADGLSKKKFVDFTSSEMISLIKSLFEDSQKRQSLLQSIAELNA